MFFFTDLEHVGTTATGIEIHSTEDKEFGFVSGGAMAAKMSDGRTMIVVHKALLGTPDFGFVLHHEVAHVLNGDLEGDKKGMQISIKAEKRADSYAIRMGCDKKEAAKTLVRLSSKSVSGMFSNLWGKSKVVTLAFSPLLVPLMGLSVVLSLTARFINIARTKV